MRPPGPPWAPPDMPGGLRGHPATPAPARSQIRPDPGPNRPSGGLPEAFWGLPEASSGFWVACYGLIRPQRELMWPY